ncbi:MAG: Gmad2 immunoglobulin-like domain-containing protein [Nocardioidaceae bacterium]
MTLSACGDSDDTNGSPTTPSETPATTTESPSPSESGSGSPSTGTDTLVVAAYFQGATPSGPVLYREFNRVEGTDPGVAAVHTALSGAKDPDYSTPWADLGVDVSEVESSGSVITIDLKVDDPASIAAAPGGMGKRVAHLAVQQLVRTAQGALEAGRTPVRFLVNGDAAVTLLGIDASKPVRTGGDFKDLANVWIDNPAEAATVRPGDKVSGLALTFEGTVRWQVVTTDDTSTILKEGFTTAAEGMKRSAFSFKFPKVEPGTYVLYVSEDDPSDGEGKGAQSDSRAVVVP